MTVSSPTEVGKGLSILIVEDEAVSRIALATLLSAYGYPTTAVATAEEALRVLENPKHRPAVALVDLDLPGMNGIEFIHHLFEYEPSIAAVLISAASRERVTELLQCGVPHLRKPLDVPHLLTLLSEKSPSH